MAVIRSRDNSRVKDWMRLALEPRVRRERALALIEGVHLLETYLQQGGRPASLIVSETGFARTEIASLVQRAGVEPVVLAEGLFNRISDAESPVGIAAEIAIPDSKVDAAESDGCIFLDGLQDAGNVGAILRTAAAFGVRDVVLGRGCADPWSPKALRAGMGGHFFLRISAVADLAAEVGRFGRVTLCTVAHGGEPIDLLDLAGRVGWIFGNEAAGVTKAVEAAATHRATILTPGGAESLNVAASAAVCLYERHRQLSKRGAGS
jgi:TrmH family RNA methyltransferase